MSYRLPTFNLPVSIYTHGTAPPTAPRVVTVGNLTPGFRQLQGRSGTTSDTIPQPINYLLLPARTDIRGYNETGGSDMVIVPNTSNQRFNVNWVTDSGSGFSNEHRVAIIQQVNPFALIGGSPPPPPSPSDWGWYLRQINNWFKLHEPQRKPRRRVSPALFPIVPAWMELQAAVNNGASTSSLSTNWPFATTTGSSLLMALITETAATPLPLTGAWTLVQSVGFDTSYVLSLYVDLGGTSRSTDVVNFSAPTVVCQVMQEWLPSNPSGLSPGIRWSNAPSSTPTTDAGPFIFTEAPYDLIIGALALPATMIDVTTLNDNAGIQFALQEASPATFSVYLAANGPYLTGSASNYMVWSSGNSYAWSAVVATLQHP